MKEPQDADPILQRHLDLKIADEACAISGPIASDFFLTLDGTFGRLRARRLAPGGTRRNKAREPALHRLEAMPSLESRQLAGHDGPCLHELLEAVMDVGQRQPGFLSDLVIESLSVFAQALENDVHSPSFAAPPA